MTQTRVVQITPHRAAELLRASDGFRNRTVSAPHVADLASLMQSGHWELTGGAIVLGPHGEVVDGQHRLRACVKAGVSFETLLLVLDDDRDVSKTWDAIDGGRKRTMSDALTRTGHKSAARLAGSLREIYNYAFGYYPWKSWPTGTSRPSAFPPNPTKPHLRAVLRVHPDVEDALRWFNAIPSAAKTMLPSRFSILMRYVEMNVMADREGSGHFTDAVWKGIDVQAGTIEETCRNRLCKEQDLRRSRQPSRPLPDLICILAKSWNNWIRMTDASSILLRKGSQPPAFEGWPPEIARQPIERAF